jgi:hypothetical protein
MRIMRLNMLSLSRREWVSFAHRFNEGKSSQETLCSRPERSFSATQVCLELTALSASSSSSEVIPRFARAAGRRYVLIYFLFIKEISFAAILKQVLTHLSNVCAHSPARIMLAQAR